MVILKFSTNIAIERFSLATFLNRMAKSDLDKLSIRCMLLIAQHFIDLRCGNYIITKIGTGLYKNLLAKELGAKRSNIDTAFKALVNKGFLKELNKSKKFVDYEIQLSV